MPWARTDWMSERVKFIAAYLEHEARFRDTAHQTAMPGRPDQNGRHERMHSTLKAETARRHATRRRRRRPPYGHCAPDGS